MPARIRIEHIPVSQTRAFLRLGITLGVAAAVALWVGGMDLAVVHTMRSWTLLGGSGRVYSCFCQCSLDSSTCWRSMTC